MTLITHYILPALQPLFDDDEKSTRLEFTPTNPANIDERPPNFDGCPDFTITVFPPQTSGGVNVGYGEVKRFSMVGNHYLVNWDLVRLALFGKRTMDRNSLASTLSVHIVGKFVLEKKKESKSYTEYILFASAIYDILCNPVES